MPVTGYYAEYAWLGGPVAQPGVLIEVRDGRIAAVTAGAPAGGAYRLPGLTLPGLANAHSHAFHRALRGRSQSGRGDFWRWREGMYALADRLDPDSYHRLARATYAEMALSGITAVGEFHYLHHAPGGRRYAEPNAMGHALIAAAADAGIRITLLDTLYLTSTVDGAGLVGPQRRFGDGSAADWARRLEGLRPAGHARIGVAAHSVRAVPADGFTAVREVAAGRPLHVHLSEQRAENEACVRVHRRTPTQLLGDLGVLGPGTTAVHATHLSDMDRTWLGDTGTAVCLCPTTERDLADGIGPARALADAGSPLCLGSDSQATIDLFEEARAVELDERLHTRRRGHFSAADLLVMASVAGHRAIGWPDAGRLAPGARADLVTLALDGVRTAGVPPLPAAVFAAGAPEVRHVVVDGRPVVRDGRHLWVDVPAELRAAIAAVTS